MMVYQSMLLFLYRRAFTAAYHAHQPLFDLVITIDSNGSYSVPASYKASVLFITPHTQRA